MNFLVIGNGFDLAHGFDTQYKDFLKYVNNFIDNPEDVKYESINKDEFHQLIKNNIWIEYFDKVTIHQNWVDFESEISKYVRFFDVLRERNFIFDDWEKIIKKDYMDIIHNLFKDYYSKSFTFQKYTHIKKTMLENLTGSKYKKWIYKSDYELKDGIMSLKINKIYFYGHSLDITDSGILLDLFECKDTEIIIFYLNDEDLGDKVTNIIKLISKEKLIERASSDNPTIIFEPIH